jgi:pyruvate/2-oxoglutarate dehydrogenase complex dihydrolipoamide dehydrogenase (E3) component
LADILTPDLCVIGAGSGGLAVAELARAYGASVVLVEKGTLGGNALNTGAVPAKALAAAAAHARNVRDGGQFGVTVEEARVNFRRVHDHIEQVIAALSPASAVSRLGALGIDVVKGTARFINRRAVVVGDTEIRARRFVIATGARSVVPAIAGVDGVPYFTADTILDNTRKLTHLVVIGTGAIAIELAQAYARLGTEVTVIGSGAFLPGLDPELAAVALKRVVEEGVRLVPNAAVTAIQSRSMGIGVAVHDGETDLLLDASHILIAGERIPNLDGLDLAKAGIRLEKSRPAFLQLTAGLRTTNAHVYAVGDVVGSQSVPAAMGQAEAVVRSAVLGALARPSGLVPRLVSTDPAIAEIGLTETTARTKHGVSFRVTRWAFADNDQARAARQTYGLAKLVTDRSGRIIGAGVVGAGASELVALFSLAMSAGMKAGDLASLTVPYPSVAEIAVRLGAEFRRGELQSPLVKYWAALTRLLG